VSLPPQQSGHSPILSQITSPRLGIQAGHTWLRRASAFRQFVLQAISLARIGDLPSPLPMANPEVFEIP